MIVIIEEFFEDAETSCIIQLLMGLNDNFINFCGQILNMKHGPGSTDFYNMFD